MITITGRTFDHRETIRGLGGYWNNADRCWQMDYASAATIGKLRALVGVMIVETQAAPEPTIDLSDDDEPITINWFSRPRIAGTNRSRIFGDDPTYHNHFADQNPHAFFGFSDLATMIDYVSGLPIGVRRDGWADG